MPTTAVRHPGRLLALVIVTALVAVPATVSLTVSLAAPARAHDVLVASDPADGSTVAVPPDQVVLTFSAEQMPLGNAFQVTDPDGTDHVVGEAVVEGRDLRQELDGEGPAGEWTVEWRSVASDGHPVSGTLTFTVSSPAEVAAGVEPGAGEGVEDTGSGAAGDTAGGAGDTDDDGTQATEGAGTSDVRDPAASADPAGTDTVDDTDEADRAAADATGPAPWLVAVLALGALAAAALVWALVRRLGPRAADDGEQHGRDPEDRP